MHRRTTLPLALAIASLACSTTRSTTTARTAVEQALLSQSAEASVGKLEVPAELRGKSYFLVADHFEASDGKWVVAQVHQRLLEAGLRAGAEKAAEIFVYPSVAHAAIDDSRVFLGSPELPIPIPNVGSISIPEVAIFKREVQLGRNRMGLHGVHASGDLAFATEPASSQRYYTRWTILFLLSFRTTDLVEPF